MFIHKFSKPTSVESKPRVTRTETVVATPAPLTTEPTMLMRPSGITPEQQVYIDKLASRIIFQIEADISQAMIESKMGLLQEAIETITRHQPWCDEYFRLGHFSKPFDMALDTCQTRLMFQDRIRAGAFFTSAPDEKQLNELRELRSVFLQ